jgi:hypothetical protein
MIITRGFTAELEIREDQRQIVGLAVPYGVQIRVGRYLESFRHGAFAHRHTRCTSPHGATVQPRQTQTTMSSLPRPCVGCGTKISSGSRCDTCRPTKAKTAARGYDARWQQLARQAITRHPWCTDCGTRGSKTNPLTGDHLRWPARILADIEVVCRRCNSRRGARRKINKNLDQGLHDPSRPITAYGDPSAGANPNCRSVSPSNYKINRTDSTVCGGSPRPLSVTRCSSLSATARSAVCRSGLSRSPIDGH